MRQGPIPLVYLVTNPAWPGWVKVGTTADLAARLSTYNVYSPRRDFTVAFKLEHGMASWIEQAVLRELRLCAEREGDEHAGEWVQCSVAQAQDAISVAVAMAEGRAPEVKATP